MTKDDLVRLLDYWQAMEGTHYCYPAYDRNLERIGLSDEGLATLKAARDELAAQDGK